MNSNKEINHDKDNGNTYRRRILTKILKYILIIIGFILFLYSLPYLNNENIKLNDLSYLIPQDNIPLNNNNPLNQNTNTNNTNFQFSLFIYTCLLCSLIFYLIYKRTLSDYEYSINHNDPSLFD